MHYNIEWDCKGDLCEASADWVRIHKVEGSLWTQIFSTRFTPSTSSNPAADETAAPGDSKTVGESESMENGEATKSGQDGGMTAKESMSPKPAHVPYHWVLVDGIWSPPPGIAPRPSAPTSPPTTTEDGQSTPKERMTTRSASCLSGPISGIMANLDEDVRDLNMLATRLDVLANRLTHTRFHLHSYFACTTQAPAAPASDGEKTTSSDSEPTARR